MKKRNNMLMILVATILLLCVATNAVNAKTYGGSEYKYKKIRIKYDSICPDDNTQG